MADDTIPDLFGDVVTDVVLVNGVFRLTVGEQDGDRQVRPVARILVPAAQLGPLLQGVGQAVRDIAGRAQTRTVQAPLPEQKTSGGSLVGEQMVHLPEEEASLPAKPARRAEPKAEAPAKADKKSRSPLALGKKLVEKARGKAKKPGKKK